MPKTLNLIFKNSFSNTMSFGVTVLTTLFLTPFIIHSLGDSDYGIWVLIGSICGFYGLLDLGISSSVVRYVSKFIAIDDSDNINGTVNTCLFLYSIIAVFILIFAWVLSILLPLVAKIPTGRESVTSAVLIVLGASLALSFPARVFRGVLQAVMRYDIASGVEIVITLLRALSIVVVLESGHGLIALALVTLAATIVQLCLYSFFAFKKYPLLKLGIGFIEKRKVKEIFNYSIFKFIASLGDVLRFNLDSVLIGAVISVSAITPYAVAQRLIRYFMTLVSEIFTVTTPLYSSYEAKSENISIQKLLTNSTFYSALIAFFIAAMFIIYGDTFITLWIGAEYSQKAYIVLVILSISFALALAQNPTIVAAYGIEKHKMLAVITVFEGVVNLILSIILAKKMGLVGVALGTAIPMVITKAIIQPVYMCRVIGLSWASYFKDCFFVNVLIAIVFTLPHLAAKRYIQIDSFYQLVGAVVVSSGVFILLSVSFLSVEQKAFWKCRLSDLKGRFVYRAGDGA